MFSLPWDASQACYSIIDLPSARSTANGWCYATEHYCQGAGNLVKTKVLIQTIMHHFEPPFEVPSTAGQHSSLVWVGRSGHPRQRLGHGLTPPGPQDSTLPGDSCVVSAVGPLPYQIMGRNRLPSPTRKRRIRGSTCGGKGPQLGYNDQPQPPGAPMGRPERDWRRRRRRRQRWRQRHRRCTANGWCWCCLRWCLPQLRVDVPCCYWVARHAPRCRCCGRFTPGALEPKGVRAAC